MSTNWDIKLAKSYFFCLKHDFLNPILFLGIASYKVKKKKKMLFKMNIEQHK